LAFVNKVSVKHKSASPSTIQVKIWQKTISLEEKLDVISRLEKGEQIVDIFYNVRHAHGSMCTVLDNSDIFVESAKSGTEVFA
jgi:hypothetical protein